MKHSVIATSDDVITATTHSADVRLTAAPDGRASAAHDLPQILVPSFDQTSNSVVPQT